MAIHNLESLSSTMTGGDGRARKNIVANFTDDRINARIETIIAFTTLNPPLGYHGARVADDRIPADIVVTLNDDDLIDYLSHRNPNNN